MSGWGSLEVKHFLLSAFSQTPTFWFYSPQSWDTPCFSSFEAALWFPIPTSMLSSFSPFPQGADTVPTRNSIQIGDGTLMRKSLQDSLVIWGCDRNPCHHPTLKPHLSAKSMAAILYAAARQNLCACCFKPASTHRSSPGTGFFNGAPLTPLESHSNAECAAAVATRCFRRWSRRLRTSSKLKCTWTTHKLIANCSCFAPSSLC